MKVCVLIALLWMVIAIQTEDALLQLSFPPQWTLDDEIMIPLEPDPENLPSLSC